MQIILNSKGKESVCRRLGNCSISEGSLLNLLWFIYRLPLQYFTAYGHALPHIPWFTPSPSKKGGWKVGGPMKMEVMHNHRRYMNKVSSSDNASDLSGEKCASCRLDHCLWIGMDFQASCLPEDVSADDVATAFIHRLKHLLASFCTKAISNVCKWWKTPKFLWSCLLGCFCSKNIAIFRPISHWYASVCWEQSFPNKAIWNKVIHQILLLIQSNIGNAMYTVYRIYSNIRKDPIEGQFLAPKMSSNVVSNKDKITK